MSELGPELTLLSLLRRVPTASFVDGMAPTGHRRKEPDAGIQYFSFVEMGNLFLDLPDWAE
jgi:hypothetical protein